MATMATYHTLECFMTEEDELMAPEYTSIGENMAVVITFTTEVEYVNFTSLIGYWYSQYEYYNVSDNTCTTSCDQFLQVAAL